MRLVLTNTHSAAIEVFIFDPAAKRRPPVFHQVALDEFHAHWVSESTLGLGGGDQVLVMKIDLQVLTAAGGYEPVGAPRPSTDFCSDSVEKRRGWVDAVSNKIRLR